jgi:acylphosphatase
MNLTLASENIKIKIIVIGKVQGVAFRYYTKMKADELGLMGSVQNMDDGSVIIHAEGQKKQLDVMTKWCHIGSPASNVSEVIIHETQIENIHPSSQSFSNYSSHNTMPPTAQFIILRGR